MDINEIIGEVYPYLRGHDAVVDGKCVVRVWGEKEPFTLEWNDGGDGVVPHIGLSNTLRAIAFQSVDELRGYLRAMRSEHQ